MDFSSQHLFRLHRYSHYVFHVVSTHINMECWWKLLTCFCWVTTQMTNGHPYNQSQQITFLSTNAICCRLEKYRCTNWIYNFIVSYTPSLNGLQSLWAVVDLFRIKNTQLDNHCRCLPITADVLALDGAADQNDDCCVTHIIWSWAPWVCH